MTVINGNKWIDKYISPKDTFEPLVWEFSDAKCLVCGEKLELKKLSIWWRGDSDIFICCDCAQHTIDGMVRDLMQLKGINQVIDKPSSNYDPIKLLREKTQAQELVGVYSRRILELQELLSRR